MEVCPHCVAAAAVGTVGALPFVKFVVLPKVKKFFNGKKEGNDAR